MRVLFVSHSFSPPGRPLENLGGMQRVAMDLHAALGDHPDVTLHDQLLRTSWAMTHVRTVPFLLKCLWQIPRLVRRHDIDVVLFSSMVTAGLAPRLRPKLEPLGTQLITIAHGQDVVLPVVMYQRYVPRVFEALDTVCPVSIATGQACLDRGLPQRKLAVVPNGISVDRFDPPLTPDQIEAELRTLGDPLPPDALLLCSVGRQVQRKGFQWFVDRVMPQLPDNVHYWMAGDGPMADEIEEAITGNKLKKRVKRLGRVTEAQLEALYHRADLFVMPNIPVVGDMEGFGVVMLEAGLCGLPSVAADLEGICDVITEGGNGHLVESGNVEAFRSIITRYEADRDALRQLAEGVRSFTLDSFSWPAVANRFVEVFRSVTSSRH